MRKSTKITLAIVGASFALHFAAWSFVGTIKAERKREIVAISLAETKKKKEEKKKEPPKPPDVKPEKAKVIQKKAPDPVPEQAPPPQQEAKASNINSYADLGLGPMGGGTGGGLPIGGGGGGGGGGGAPPPPPTATQRHVALTPTNDCVEDVVKPKRSRTVNPLGTDAAKAAGIDGEVILEITVDATGHVVNVRVIKGLGYGLDESAMTAARQWSYAPATKCGKAVPWTLKSRVLFQ